MIRSVYIGFLFTLLAGCFNPTMTVDGRTALEQELTRVAILRALSKLPVHKDILNGQWKITLVSPNSKDDSWILTQVRQHLTGLGANISVNTVEKLPQVEAVVHFAGSDVDSFVLGVTIPGSMGQSSVSFYHENRELGRALIQLNFWSIDGKLVAQTPRAYAETHFSDATIFTFIGPFSFTDLDDVPTYGRFIEQGKDGWKESSEFISDTENAVSNDWIAP